MVRVLRGALRLVVTLLAVAIIDGIFGHAGSLIILNRVVQDGDAAAVV